jgi:uncharacterized protein DUF1566
MTTRQMALRALALAIVASVWTATAGATLTPAQKCEVAKNKAAGKLAACLSSQRAKEVKGRVPDYRGCTDKMGAAFGKADFAGVGSCPTTGDASRIERRIYTQFYYSSYQGSTVIPMALSGTRWVDNGDGTVSDTLTGLMWEKKTDDGTIHDKDNAYTWSSSGTVSDGTAFTQFLGTLNSYPGFAFYTDWRLPTIAELRTIIDLSSPCGGVGSPCIDPIFGPPQPGGPSWSSTSLAGFPGEAWAVYFANGAVGVATKTPAGFVRAVRGGL